MEPEAFDNFIEKEWQNNKILTISTKTELIDLFNTVLNEEEKFFYRGVDNQKNILPTLFREIELEQDPEGSELFNYLNGNSKVNKLAKLKEYNLYKDLTLLPKKSPTFCK